MQPTGEARGPADGSCLVGQHEKGCLESVLGVVPVSQNPLADAENHRPVPLDESRECFLIAAVHKGLQKLSLRHGRFAADDEAANRPLEVIAMRGV